MGWMEAAIRRRGGSVDFRTFMELALYDADHGYYARGPVRYGRKGDYLTAPTASDWYTAVLARLFEGLAARAGAPLRVVDAASGDGSFLAGLLAAWDDRNEAVEMISVERSAALRRIQEERLPPGRVRTVTGPRGIGPWDGLTVFHASELYDALPVHRVVGRDGGLAELWVEAGEGGLRWAERPAPEPLVRHFESRGVRLEEGQVAEACLEAGPLHRSLLAACGAPAAAFVLDYGYPARRLYDPRGRRGGSLACYAGHRMDRDPLDRPGGKDITAHVDWDTLREATRAAGWVEVALVPLAEFLVRGGIAALVEARGLGLEREVDAASWTARQEIKRLLDPDGMGSDLRVLVQATPDAAPLVSEALGLRTG